MFMCYLDLDSAAPSPSYKQRSCLRMFFPRLLWVLVYSSSLVKTLLVKTKVTILVKRSLLSVKIFIFEVSHNTALANEN